MKELKQSTTITIHRSQINLNPFNPKRHTDEKIKLQRANLQQVGFLGGITWNQITGNLIDGHRRIQAMDLHYKYDGTQKTDYSVKVEAVEMGEKAEKEQMTYMALGNTKADLDLVSRFIGEIDYKNAGISGDEYDEIIRRCTPTDPPALEIETIDPFESIGPSYEEKKADIKETKAQIKEKAMEDALNQESYITVSFSDFRAKSAFCELLNVDPRTTRFIKGEELLNILE